MRRIHRFFSLLCAAVLLCSIFVLTATAATAKASITVNSSERTVGSLIKMTVSYTASEAIGSWNFQLLYDKSSLEYISGADSGGDGVLNFCNYSDNADQKTISQTVTFKALAVSTSNVSTNTLQIVSNETISEMSYTNTMVQVSIKPVITASEDANLSSLRIAPGTISPSFSPSVTEYSATVGNSVTSVAVSASVAHSAATKQISSTKLDVGSNKITVTVTAEAGNKKTYVIYVTRKSASGQSSGGQTKATTDSGTSTTEQDIGIIVNGISYVAVSDIEGITAPTVAILPSAITFGGKEYPAFVTEDELVKLVCLADSENNAQWFVFDEEKQSFLPYRTFTSASNDYIIYDIPKEYIIPSGYEATQKDLGTQTEVRVLVKSGEAEHMQYLVLASRQGRGKELYTYDVSEHTFSKYIAPVVASAVYTRDYVSELNDANTRLNTAENNLKLSRILFIAVAALLILFVIIVTVLIVRLSKKAKGEKKPEPADEQKV